MDLSGSNRRPLRIGILTDGLEERAVDGTVRIANGGVGVYIYNLVAHLRRLDAEHRYVTIRCGGGALDLYQGGASDEHVALPHSPWHRVARWLDLPYARLARELRLDLLHYPNQFGGAFLPRRTRRVVTLHDITPLLFPHHHPRRSVLGYRLLMRRSLAAANHIIVDATHTADDLVARGAASRDRLSVIPLAASERFTPDVRSDDFLARYDLPERYLLTVGVLEPRKNHVCLIRALQRLHQQGEQVGLAIVGREGWRWRDPLDDAGAAHLRSWVRIYRDVPDADLPELYGRAAAFVYPSLYEGFGLPVIEAMACGTPVVASHTSSLAEVAGGAALLADPHDPDDVAAKLRAVLRDPALRRQLVAAGHDRAHRLSWRRTAERTREVYERVCWGR